MSELNNAFLVAGMLLEVTTGTQSPIALATGSCAQKL